jgi:serine/threonine protein kinase
MVRATGLHPTFGFTAPLSASAQDLIQRMLEIDPEERISLSEVMSHPWVKKSKFPKFW